MYTISLQKVLFIANNIVRQMEIGVDYNRALGSYVVYLTLGLYNCIHTY